MSLKANKYAHVNFIVVAKEKKSQIRVYWMKKIWPVYQLKVDPDTCQNRHFVSSLCVQFMELRGKVWHPCFPHDNTLAHVFLRFYHYTHTALSLPGTGQGVQRRQLPVNWFHYVYKKTKTKKKPNSPPLKNSLRMHYILLSRRKRRRLW